MNTGSHRMSARPWRVAPQMPGVRRGLNLSPLALVGGFALLILTGSLLLALPMSTAPGYSTGALDALFTSTSAVCVTGLVVFDTGTHWSPLGQAILLVLIQIGGFGFMTSATLLLLAFRRRIGLRQRLLVGETIGISVPGGLRLLIGRMAAMTVACEIAGAVLLFPRLAPMQGSARGVWTALFQSVSAFNNAGFDVFGDFVSLIGVRTDAVVVLVTASLLVIGGLSYVVLADVYRKRRFVRLSLDSKLVLATTGVLLAGGACVYLAAEWGNPGTFGPLTIPQKVLCALFQAVTPRTAGFTTVNVGAMYSYTLGFTIFLMFIGGAAGSTAGGIKVNTFGVLIAVVVSTLRGRGQAEAFGRELSVPHVYRALVVVVLALLFVGVAALLLSLTEEFSLLDVTFEAVSAFGTVGLSTGITPFLSEAGRLIIISSMFVGRLGPLYVATALVQRQRKQEYHYPVEAVRIG